MALEVEPARKAKARLDNDVTSLSKYFMNIKSGPTLVRWHPGLERTREEEVLRVYFPANSDLFRTLSLSQGLDGYRIVVTKTVQGSFKDAVAIEMDKDCRFENAKLSEFDSKGNKTHVKLLNSVGEIYDEIQHQPPPLKSLAEIYQGVHKERLKVSLTELEKLSTSKHRTVVAVIDSGVDYNHPALAYKLLRVNPILPSTRKTLDELGALEREKLKIGSDTEDEKKRRKTLDGRIRSARMKLAIGWSFKENGELPFDDTEDSILVKYPFHGTHVSGIAVSGNDRLALLPIRGNLGEGFFEQVSFARLRGARIVNLSIQSLLLKETSKKEIEKTIRAFPDVLFTVAAGNDGEDIDAKKNPCPPTGMGLPNVLVVAAADSNGNLANFSNHGEKTVHLAAPGTVIESLRPSGKVRKAIWDFYGLTICS